MLITETLLKVLLKFYILFCVCVSFIVLMVWINPLIVESLKPDCHRVTVNACARWAQFSRCHRGGVCTDGLSPPSLLAAIFFYYYYYFFLTSRGLLGPLTCSKTLENWHTPWNLRPLGPGRDWYTGVAQGLYSAPWNIEGHISSILARIHMKLGTHVDLIKPNNFRTACHKLRPTGSWLFRVL